ncbi:DUF2867 domain-containing protein [Salipiger sp. P9]|uniref:DUF2867 domain-containing protein n=1 Tax=Salipiger pentaromativorans TaxID=2943193 RepID=UPI0021570914|nr:DUF2867 domain-containing protein [Salipiger pentaromativorans]MCR8550266.1 DUF2867 domain-containing protein [Salipiger pentaromativorans]
MILPPNIHVLRAPETLDYYHAQTVVLPVGMSALELWNRLMTQPLPLMSLAFRLRDAISARFGVRKIGGFSGQRADQVAVGDRLDFFLVEHVAPDVLVLTERDRHLDVMTCLSTSENRVTITSSVVTHNAFGRAYMLPVGIAHKLFVGAMLRRLKRSFESGQPAV